MYMAITMYTSLITSIVIQVITGIIEIVSIFFKVPRQFLFLKQMMMLEIGVQMIEGLFYLYWLFHFKTISNITPRRYFDWMITTPSMLVNLIFYLIFLKNKDANLNFFTLFKKEFNTIFIVLLLNWAMLLFGYLGETMVIPILLGVALGFIPFLLYYYIIYEHYAVFSSDTGMNIFYYFFIFWLLYGIVAVLPYKLKNMGYNILDLFSKNFFGLFLAYQLFINQQL
jgi:hypothetical protein